MNTAPPTLTPAIRRGHVELPELAGGLSLSVESLRRRDDADKMETFIQMLANAEYWLSFDLHSFEPILASAPSPLRELGVAAALRFSERVDGRLSVADLDAAEQFVLRRIAPDLRAGVTEGLNRLKAVVDTRDQQESLAAEGYVAYDHEPALSVHALRAMGRAHIIVDGDRDRPNTIEAQVGHPVRLSSIDDKDRPLDPPEIETDTGAPLLVRSIDGARDVIFMVPGRYRIRVPGRASGDKKVMVR